MGATRKSGIARQVLTLGLLLLTATAGCGVKKESPAPGCVEYWGMAPSGGCMGKTAILDLQVEPDPDCLSVRVNNCNGGILDIDNLCEATLVVAGVEIAPGTRSAGLDVAARDPETGQVTLTWAHGNFSRYIPAADQTIVVLGTLGDVSIRITFTKTRELC